MRRKRLFIRRRYAWKSLHKFSRQVIDTLIQILMNIFIEKYHFAFHAVLRFESILFNFIYLFCKEIKALLSKNNYLFLHCILYIVFHRFFIYFIFLFLLKNIYISTFSRDRLKIIFILLIYLFCYYNFILILGYKQY